VPWRRNRGVIAPPFERGEARTRAVGDFLMQSRAASVTPSAQALDTLSGESCPPLHRPANDDSLIALRAGQSAVMSSAFRTLRSAARCSTGVRCAVKNSSLPPSRYRL
jgi:hypothetical protein